MRYPIFFYNYHICIKCGSHNVVPIDKFGRESKSMIYPISKMRCKRCGTEYIVKWITKDGKRIPVCTGDDELHNIEDNIVEYSKAQKRKI